SVIQQPFPGSKSGPRTVRFARIRVGPRGSVLLALVTTLASRPDKRVNVSSPLFIRVCSVSGEFVYHCQPYEPPTERISKESSAAGDPRGVYHRLSTSRTPLRRQPGPSPDRTVVPLSRCNAEVWVQASDHRWRESSRSATPVNNMTA